MLTQIVVTTTTTTTAQSAASDPALERVAWALAAAVIGLIVNQVWQVWRLRRDRRARDRTILSAVTRELAVIRAVAYTIQHDVYRENQTLREQGRWQLKPLLRVPANTYDLIKDDPPAALLHTPLALIELLALMRQCVYTNQLVDQQFQWKIPGASREPEHLVILGSFQVSIMDSATKVIERVDRVLPMVTAAGEQVGGLFHETGEVNGDKSLQASPDQVDGSSQTETNP
jgi:hypothetical protein